MHVIETTVYEFDELSDSAKETAREWFREGNLDYEWWDCVEDDAKHMGKLIGIDIDKMYFSGFWSQGDGACFTGSYEYKAGGVKAIKEEAPLAKDLHGIAEALARIQKPNFYSLSARVGHSGHYWNSAGAHIDVFSDRDGDYSETNDGNDISQCLREFMDWIYQNLEREYDYLQSDEHVDEDIRANSYTFTEEGEREG